MRGRIGIFWVVSILFGSLCFSAEHPAVLKVSAKNGNGTGVVVDGNRLVTVSHVARLLGDELRFSGGIAKRITDITDKGEYPVYYTLPGGPWESLTIATSLPMTGEKVVAMGYAYGSWAEAQGTYEGLPNGLIKCRLKVGPGASGGPLMNAKGELIGLTSATAVDLNDPTSFFVPVVQPSSKAIVFTKDGCAPCAWFKAEIGGTGLHVNEINGEQDSNEKRMFELRVGLSPSDIGFPVFWVQGGTDYINGFSKGSAPSVASWFRARMKKVNGPPDVRPPLQGSRATEPQPASPQVIQLEPGQVEIIILVAKQEKVPGIAATASLGLSRGVIRRAVDEHLQGKARVELVSEREAPGRYRAIGEAADMLLTSPVSVLVLVARADLGLKGLIASKVEAMVRDKIPGTVPIDFIFERAHPQDFRAISEALVTREGDAYDRPGVRPRTDPDSSQEPQTVEIPGLTATLTSLESKLGEVSESQEKLQGDLSAVSKEQTTGGWVTKFIAFFAALGGASSTTHGVRSWLRDKAVSKVSQVIHGSPSSSA